MEYIIIIKRRLGRIRRKRGVHASLHPTSAAAVGGGSCRPTDRPTDRVVLHIPTNNNKGRPSSSHSSSPFFFLVVVVVVAQYLLDDDDRSISA